MRTDLSDEENDVILSFPYGELYTHGLKFNYKLFFKETKK